MRFFERRQYREALAHAAQGGQALFIHAWHGQSRIRCFDGAPFIGKLFDQDRERLMATVRRLGVRVVAVDRAGQPEQHVDLVGRPLQRAKAEAEEGSDEF